LNYDFLITNQDITPKLTGPFKSRLEARLLDRIIWQGKAAAISFIKGLKALSGGKF